MTDIAPPPLPADFHGVTPGMTTDEVRYIDNGNGSNETVPVQQDYFGFNDTRRIMLPDNVSWVEIRLLNEGARCEYLNTVNQEVRLDRQGRDAYVKTKAGDERKILLKLSIIGWNLQRGGVAFPFSKTNLEKFLESAPPSVADVIEKEVRKVNKWLTSELTLEDIAEQRKELDRMEQEVLDRLAGKAS
jgi:hypothetical protein